MRYNVRCCCEPNKILGSIELSDDLAEKARRTGVRTAAAKLVPQWLDPRAVLPEPNFEEITIELRRAYCNKFEIIDGQVRTVRETELAVYSDDRPLEFWMRLPKFFAFEPGESQITVEKLS